MKCFEHHDQDAVGICKHCQKGICIKCATDLESGLACKGIHERDVEFLNSLIENNKKAYSQSKKSVLMSNIFFLLMGVLFVGFGWPHSRFLVGFGMLCIAYWLALALYNHWYLKKLRTDYEDAQSGERPNSV